MDFHEIVTDLYIISVATKFVPQLLSKEQEEFHSAVARGLIQTANKTQIFYKWLCLETSHVLFLENQETKAQSSCWKSPRSSYLKEAWQDE